MVIYPAVDIRGGQCVRLTQGQYDNMTVFSQNPLEVALKFENQGASYLHVVDLDAARGEASNRGIIGQIAKTLSIPVQTGGGIRTMEDIEDVLKLGIERVILGTAAVKKPELVKEAVLKYPDRIAVGIDAKNRYVAIEGWEKITRIKAVEFAKYMESLGVRVVIYTDIAKDGMLSGPNLSAMEEIVLNTQLEVIASGGVTTVDDIINLNETGVKGVIIGKALYTGSIDLKEAFEAIKSSGQS